MYQRDSRPVRLIQLEQAAKQNPELFVFLVEAWIVGNIGFKQEASADLSEDPMCSLGEPSELDRQLARLSPEELAFLLGADALDNAMTRATVFDGAPIVPDITWRELGLAEVA